MAYPKRREREMFPEELVKILTHRAAEEKTAKKGTPSFLIFFPEMSLKAVYLLPLLPCLESEILTIHKESRFLEVKKSFLGTFSYRDSRAINPFAPLFSLSLWLIPCPTRQISITRSLQASECYYLTFITFAAFCKLENTTSIN